MTQLCAPAEAGLDRHRLVRLHPQAWAGIVAGCEEARGEPLIERWADRGWPLVVRRAGPGDAGAVPLGLPLPPSLGKRRLSFSVARADVLADAPPPRLAEGRAAAPAPWSPTIDAVLIAAAGRGTEVRCFGSLAWETLTGLRYLSPTSDLDLLLAPRDLRETAALCADLAEVEARAPMRLDGEILRPDGVAANWREIHAGAEEVLVKSRRGVGLWRRDRFLGAAS